MKAHPRSGFTLIELLTVMAIIAILAGLILGTAGYVQKKAARDRARSEIAAMEAALESYKADNGIYPPSPQNATTPPSVPATGGADILYQALTGDGDDLLGGSESSTGVWGRQGKVYMEPKDSQMDSTKRKMQDPFGTEYRYASPGYYNTATFDLWSGSAPGSDLVTWENEKVNAKNW